MYNLQMRALDIRHYSKAFQTLPFPVRELFNTGNHFIAGGYFSDILRNQKPKDIDIFFPSMDFFTRYYENLLQATNQVKYVTVLPHGKLIHFPDGNVNLINSFFAPTLYDLLASFDFTVCAAGISNELRLCVGPYYEHHALMTLDYMCPIKDSNPAGSLLRALKYSRKGFTITMPVLQSIFNQIKMKCISIEEMQNLILLKYPNSLKL